VSSRGRFRKQPFFARKNPDTLKDRRGPAWSFIGPPTGRTTAAGGAFPPRRLSRLWGEHPGPRKPSGVGSPSRSWQGGG
jgi:hypothetical protein